MSSSQIEAVKQEARQHSAASHRVRGFTMVELITVMVILGIIATVAAPRFFDRNTFDSRGFYDQIISTLRYAQKAAIAQHRFVCASFPANNSVTLTYGATNACADGTLASPSGDPYPLTSNQASFTAIPLAFSFDALGKPSFATQTSIAVNGYATPILIEAETGYVH